MNLINKASTIYSQELKAVSKLDNLWNDKLRKKERKTMPTSLLIVKEEENQNQSFDKNNANTFL